MQRNISFLTLAALIIATGSAMAEEASPISFNVGVVSNYMWRGLSQSANHAVVQGGIDFEHESGFSLGTFVSSLDGHQDPSYEWDIYAGFGKTVGDFSYNISLSYYAYPDPDAKNWNFSELGVSGTWKMVTVGLDYTLDGEAPKGSPFREGDLNYHASLSFDLPMDIILSGTLGYYDFDASPTPGSDIDYTYWQIGLSRDFGRFGTFNVSYDQNNGGTSHLVAADDDAKFWVGWTKTF